MREEHSFTQTKGDAGFFLKRRLLVARRGDGGTLTQAPNANPVTEIAERFAWLAFLAPEMQEGQDGLCQIIQPYIGGIQRIHPGIHLVASNVDVVEIF